MKPKDVRKKSEEELLKEIAKLQEELREFRFGMSGAGKRNIRTPRKLKGTIARIRTILTEKK